MKEEKYICDLCHKPIEKWNTNLYDEYQYGDKHVGIYQHLIKNYKLNHLHFDCLDYIFDGVEELIKSRITK